MDLRQCATDLLKLFEYQNQQQDSPPTDNFKRKHEELSSIGIFFHVSPVLTKSHFHGNFLSTFSSE
jgi:hypothetical protein